jgi:8-amino-7-oxononanoate synthase
LHAFWDLFVTLDRGDLAIYMDATLYPIARWGIERAASRGTPVRTFKHHDPVDLARWLAKEARARHQALVVTDGLCPGCGDLAPIHQYLEQASEFGGRLVLDDTQVLGIFGHSPGLRSPYGSGGGGSLRINGIEGSPVLLVSSLAKGFGVPMAMLGGNAAEVALLEAESATRVHCSPPSNADLHAADHAIELNRAAGDALRLRLLGRVRRFRRGLLSLGLPVGRSLFPVQSLKPTAGIDVQALHRRLTELGIRALLHRPACTASPRVSFLITALHTSAEIDRTIEAIAIAAESTAFSQPTAGEQ